MYLSQPHQKSLTHQILLYTFITLGAFLAAFAIEVFLLPNRLIDGGIVGIAMIFANIFGVKYLSVFIVLFNLPFVFLAYKSIGKVFVIHMVYALISFAISVFVMHHYFPDAKFIGESIEVVVIGGAILGVGLGLIIRYGACLDGTEILAIILNKRTGITVGSTVLMCNIFVFGALGLYLQEWHPPILSMITYMVVTRVMDTVIVGLDETKSVLIISTKPKAIADAIIHELGLGLTIMYGRGGFSGDEREILYVIAERLQLAELKELIHREDPQAFIAIENLHEVAYGTSGPRSAGTTNKTRMEHLFERIFKPG
jgi:uncharacterized membrane-anchored protein YitT (DUF2179 family)